MALASKLRVLAYEVPQAELLWQQLSASLQESFIPPLPLEWYNQCHCKVLLDARSLAASYGVTHTSITAALRSRMPHGGEINKYLQANYQREAYHQLMLRGGDSIRVEDRHRHKQVRWKLEIPARIGAVRAVSLFERLAPLVRPRVLASLARAHWNAWCTKRRFQQEGLCVFCCSARAYDSIEHYLFCPRFYDLLDNFLHLPRFTGLQEFLLIDHRLWSDCRLAISAIAVHALYTAFNHARLCGPRPKDYIVDYMQRSCYHAVLNHSKSQGALRAALSNTRHWWR